MSDHRSIARARRARLFPKLILLFLIAIACSAGLHNEALASPDQAGQCIVIDSDADLDDFRAVSALVPNHHVVAIVVTEGISRSSQGVGAMEALLARGGYKTPVIPGINPSSDRGYKPDEGLAGWRSNAERLNGLLPEPIVPSSAQPSDLAAALRRYTAGCSHVSLLMIGPWTSFIRYAPEFLRHVDQIVAQGRPFPDEPGGEPAGFNCTYDIDSCVASFDLLVGRRQRADRKLRAEWIDIPSSPQACGSAEPGVDEKGTKLFAFRPVAAWSEALQHEGGMASVMADVLKANPSGLDRTSLWDDLAALYLLRPDVFVQRGGHYEPCIPASTVRTLLTEYMAGKA